MQNRFWYRTSIRRLLGILFAMWTVSTVHAQNVTISGVRIQSPNRLIIATSADKAAFQSVLSGDKRKVVITVRNAVLATDTREANSAKGILQTAFVRSSGRDVTIIADLRDTAGFTAVSMPYSQSIAIDFFQWNALTSSEAAYRNGLLAWQSGAYDLARNYFKQSERASHPDATAMLGVLYALAGNNVDAMMMLQRALDRKTTIVDSYAALASMFRGKGDEMKARDYENDFRKQTGRLPAYSFGTISLSEPSSDLAASEPSSLAEEEELSASVPDTTVDSTQSKGKNAEEALVAQLRQLQSSSNRTVTDTTSGSNSSSGNIFTILTIIGVSALIMSLVGLRGYFRWRKMQKQRIMAAAAAGAGPPTVAPATAPAFHDDLATAMAVNERAAASAYKSQEMNVDALRQMASAAVAAAAAKSTSNEAEGEKESEADTPEEIEEDKPEELFDFGEEFYAARKRAVEKTSDPTTTTSYDATRSTVASAILNSNTPPQVSGLDKAYGAFDVNLQKSSTPETSGNGDSGTKDDTDVAAGDPPPSQRILEQDDDSIAALAQQLGLNPEKIASRRRKDR